MRVAACLLVLGLVLSGPQSVSGQERALRGRITDASNGLPVVGATVQLRSLQGEVLASAFSDEQGSFRIDTRAGEVVVTVRALGYTPATNVAVPSNADVPLNIALAPAPLPIARIVVSASRRQQKYLDAPAAVRVVHRDQIENRPALTPAAHLEQAGADIARTGLVQANIVTRGFTNVFSGRALLLTDYRYAEVPSLALNAYHFLPMVDDDIERIELVQGPASALYGPNTALGVVHVVTRSPFQSAGTSLSVMSGLRASASPARTAGIPPTRAQRGLAELSLRHAGVLSERWAYKISGRYLDAGDWPGYDPVEDSLRARALAGGADPATLRIGLRSFDVERWSGEARIDFRPRDDTEIIATAGMNKAVSSLGMTTVGFSQTKGWEYRFYQLRARQGAFFAQAFLNTSAAGETYGLRTGASTIDDSRAWAAQAQHSVSIGSREQLVYGTDFRRTEPRTSGTISGRNEDDDIVNEVGVYIHSDTRVARQLSFTSALRVDHNDRLPDPVFSVRGALQFQPRETHGLRLVFNRAFEAPVPVNLFLDIVTANLGPYNLRALGVPKAGLQFRRDCLQGVGGLCMRSALASDRSAPLPADASQVWAGIVAALRARGGPDLSSVPAPPASAVPSVLRKLDLTRGVYAALSPDDLIDVPPLQPTITETIEAGYKGLLGDRVLLAGSVYYTRKKSFLGSLTLQTPNVFFDTGPLETYLRGYLSQTAAAAAALAIGGQAGTRSTGIPAGTVVPESPLTASPDLILSLRNYGRVALWGADAQVDALLGHGISVGASYGWASDNVFPEIAVGPDTLALNAPRHKISAVARYGSGESFNAELRARHNSGFTQNSGVYRGIVPKYTLVDASAAWRLPFFEKVRATISAENLFDNRHREFVGAPELGRLLLVRLGWAF